MAPRSDVARYEIITSSGLLCIALGVTISTAIDRQWELSAAFGVFALLSAGLFWAAWRRSHRGQRDVVAAAVTIGVIVVLVATLSVLSLIKWA